MMPSATASFVPVFDWSSPRGRKIAVISFILGSAAIHALCFYLFQIIYPPTVALRSPPARVNIITAASEEGRLLLRWLAAEDPALSSTTQRPLDATFSLPVPKHVPSYVSRKPVLREPPLSQPDLRVPSSHPPAPVPLPRGLATAPAGVTPTELKFGPDTDWLGPPNIPPWRFSMSRKDPPRPAEFRLAISARGDVRYCFLQTSSGDPALDEQARHRLLLSRFSPIKDRDPAFENDLFWTTATFEWGNDITSPSDAAADVPAP